MLRYHIVKEANLSPIIGEPSFLFWRSPMINYEKYRLSRIVTVQEIVSADYVEDYLL